MCVRRSLILLVFVFTTAARVSADEWRSSFVPNTQACEPVWSALSTSEVLLTPNNSSHFSGGGGQIHGSLQNSSKMCGGGGESDSCCKSALVAPLLKSDQVSSTWFNNSLKYRHFRNGLTTHLEYMTTEWSGASSSGVNTALWNATIHGLTVLRDWGLKYWDSEFLRDNLLSSECATKVVEGAFCGLCTTKTPVQPCKTLCHNIVIGCLKSPLAEYVEEPWKHAVNSVRTTVRLIMTNSSDGVNKHLPTLQDLISDLNVWREPISWWIGDNQLGCETLPDSNCWNGESVGQYEFPVARWRSNYNLEFTQKVSGSSANTLHPSVIVTLDKFRNELVGVKRSLEKYWPTAGQTDEYNSMPRHPHALPLSSSEDLHHDEDGSGGYDDDDEEVDYVSSGYGSHVIESDDEDLHGYEGSASGFPDPEERDDTNSTPNKFNPPDIGIDPLSGGTDTWRPPVNITGSGGSSTTGGVSARCSSSPIPKLLVALVLFCSVLSSL